MARALATLSVRRVHRTDAHVELKAQPLAMRRRGRTYRHGGGAVKPIGSRLKLWEIFGNKCTIRPSFSRYKKLLFELQKLELFQGKNITKIWIKLL